MMYRVFALVSLVCRSLMKVEKLSDGMPTVLTHPAIVLANLLSSSNKG